MADEISAKINLSVVKNDARVRVDITKLSDMAGDGIETGTQVIGPTATQLTIGMVATKSSSAGNAPAGMAYIRNLTSSTSTLGFIQVSVDNTFGPTTTFANLAGGQWMLVPLQRNDIYLKSGSGNLLIEKAILDP